MGSTDIGAQLRSAREAQGLSIDALALRTRVQPRIIAAIERNDIASIPPKPYGRGFIRAYAHEVGLDPEQAVREYFGQFAALATESVSARPEPEPWPPRGTWLVHAGALVAVLVLLAVFQGDTPDAVDTRTPPPVGTAGSPVASARPDTSLGRVVPFPSPLRKVADRPSSAAAPLSIVLTADRTCWVTARADGARVLYQLLQAGAEHTIRASHEVVLRAGDAGALRITVNGRSTGVFGADGQVRTARITADAVDTTLQ